MNTIELERMVTRLIGDGTSFENMIRTAETSTARAAGVIQFHSRKIESFAGSLKLYASSARGTIAQLAALTGVAGIGGTLFESVRRSASMEQTTVAFTSLVGNTEKAKAALKDLQQFAAETPFELPEIMAAAKQMIGFGEDASNIVPTMRMLGDVASALNIPLGQLTYVFGTLKAQGRAFTVDINQFATRGIPIWEELSKVMGVSTTKIRDLVEKGQVGFPQVEAAFKNMTGAGGRFNGMMLEQSQTLIGLWSTLKDNVGMALTKFGDAIVQVFRLKEVLRSLIETTNKVADWFQGPMFTSGVKLAIDALDTIKSTVANLYERGVESAIEFYEANKETIKWALTAAGVIMQLRTAYTLLGLAIGLTNFALTILKVKQLLGIGLWLTYIGVLGIVKGMFLVFNAAVMVQGFLVNALWAAWGLYTAATATATAGTGILTGALAILEAETIIPLIAAAVTLGFVLAAAGAAMVAVGTASNAAYKSVVGLIDAFKEMGTSEETISRIGGIVDELGGHLKMIVKIAQTDMQLAWEYAKGTFNLFVAHVQQRFPALWEFVRAVAEASIKYIGAVFYNEFERIFLYGKKLTTTQFTVPMITMFLEVGAKIREAAGELLVFGLRLAGILKALGPVAKQAGEELQNALGKIDIETQIKNSNAADVLKEQMAKAKEALDAAMAEPDNKNVERARTYLKELEKDFEIAQEMAKNKDKTNTEAAKNGEKAGGAFAKAAIHEIHKFDAALAGSVEAATRVSDYLDKMRSSGQKAGAMAANGLGLARPGDAPKVSQQFKDMIAPFANAETANKIVEGAKGVWGMFQGAGVPGFLQNIEVPDALKNMSAAYAGINRADITGGVDNAFNGIVPSDITTGSNEDHNKSVEELLKQIAENTKHNDNGQVVFMAKIGDP